MELEGPAPPKDEKPTEAVVGAPKAVGPGAAGRSCPDPPKTGLAGAPKADCPNAEAGAAMLVAPNAGVVVVFDWVKADTGVDAAPKADTGAEFAIPPTTGLAAVPNAGGAEFPNADAGPEDAPNADADVGVAPKADVGLEADPKAGPLLAPKADAPNADAPGAVPPPDDEALKAGLPPAGFPKVDDPNALGPAGAPKADALGPLGALKAVGRLAPPLVPARTDASEKSVGRGPPTTVPGGYRASCSCSASWRVVVRFPNACEMVVFAWDRRSSSSLI